MIYRRFTVNEVIGDPRGFISGDTVDAGLFDTDELIPSAKCKALSVEEPARILVRSLETVSLNGVIWLGARQNPAPAT